MLMVAEKGMQETGNSGKRKLLLEKDFCARGDIFLFSIFFSIFFSQLDVFMRLFLERSFGWGWSWDGA